MQVPVKKNVRTKMPRWCWLIPLTVVAIIAAVFLLRNQEMAAANRVLYREMTDGCIITRETEDVASITVTFANGEKWSVTQTSDGVLTQEGAGDWNVDPLIAEMLLNAAATVGYEEILSEDPSEYATDLSQYGLDDPAVTACFCYTDGQKCTVRIGKQSVLDDDTYYYMTVEGDERLFALDSGTAQTLMTDQMLFHPVEQPGINPNLIDRIEVADAEGKIRAGWQLEGKITDTDAAEKWIVTEPIRYPADPDRINELLGNTGNLYLGIHVESADHADLAAYGLDMPEAVVTLHMEAGTVGQVNAEGQYYTVEQPEKTVRFAVGAMKNEMVRYVCYEGSIYTMNAFQLDVFLNADASETASRYPVSVAFENLASLVTETDGKTHEYILTHEWTTDDEGNTVHNGICLKDGEEISYAAFEAAYERLRVVTVSGKAEKTGEVPEDPYMKYTFRTLSGGTHTAEFYQTDIYHDDVACDGSVLFYIFRGSMTALP